MASLGISHLYSSPILTARPGSMHGYDVTDPNEVNPELGGEPGLRALVAALRTAGMGLVVDIVPNHMAAGGMENSWWGDVLQHGPASRFASYFDIDWEVMQGKLLAPFLGEPYGNVLRSGELKLVHDDGPPVIRYYDTVFPIRPEDYAEIDSSPADAYNPADEQGRARLHRLLDRQHYRLAWWRCAGDEINWRRFFDINGLAGMRIEHPEVFEATHALLLRLYAEGLIDGFRVDHVDGLTDPPGYCRRLRARMQELSGGRPVWLVVEKILGSGEHLPDDWCIDGTSGYDFMDHVGALLHDAAGQGPLQRLWQSISGRSGDMDAEETAGRRDLLARAFAAQLDAAAGELHRFAYAQPEMRDTTFGAIRRALRALLLQFRVYRTYGAASSAAFEAAMARATEAVDASDRQALALLGRWLTGEAPQRAIHKFQQLSAPLAAKALEDTAYYRSGVLLSRNEVGADSGRFSMTAEQFHAACIERHRRFPDAMLATATHDHKRGEDVRARLAVLSELPDEWAATVHRWFTLNADHRRAAAAGPMPSPGDELMLYQMIVGAWPVGLLPCDADGMRQYADRLADWQLKALREAKLATNWIAPDLEYEDAARSLLYTIMADADGFAAEAAAFVRRIEPAGAVNSLAQALLKLTVPGVPDFYQGAEFWDLSLVDPDNRRPVDFPARTAALEAGRADWRDGSVKQHVIHRALTLRREQPALFARGDYAPLAVSGPAAAHVVAFVRTWQGTHCVVVVPRLVASVLGEGQVAPDAAAWHGTVVEMPGVLSGKTLVDRINGRRIALARRQDVACLLSALPVALLAPD